jgi:hypothetical protein
VTGFNVDPTKCEYGMDDMEVNEKDRLEPGDVLIARGNKRDQVGNAGVVPESCSGWVCANLLMRTVVDPAEEQIAATALDTPDDSTWSDSDRLLVALADELYETDRIGDTLWEGLVATWPPAHLLELIVTAGWYRTLSYVINAARIQHEAWAARFPRSDRPQDFRVRNHSPRPYIELDLGVCPFRGTPGR